MPLKIYLPNGDEATWESEMLKVSKKADHQHERMMNNSTPQTSDPHRESAICEAAGCIPVSEKMSIDNKMKQIFPRGPWEPPLTGDVAIEAAKVKYYSENDVKPEAPAHYAKGGIETIDYIRAKLSPEEYCGYCRGNVMKYISRYTEKGGLDDLRKLLVYAGWLVEAYEKRLVFPHKVVE